MNIILHIPPSHTDLFIHLQSDFILAFIVVLFIGNCVLGMLEVSIILRALCSGVNQFHCEFKHQQQTETGYKLRGCCRSTNEKRKPEIKVDA